MSDKKLEQQLQQTNAAVMQLQRQVQNAFNQSRGAPVDDYDEYDDYDAPPPGYDQGGYQDPYGQAPDPNKIVLQAITNQATQNAVKAIKHQQAATNQVMQNTTARMKRITQDYPAMADENSEMVHLARQIFSRITQENPSLDVPTKYELAAHEAAAKLGARPVTTPAEQMVDWTMGTSHNPAVSTKSSKSRLTPAILANARLMGVNIDPKTKEGRLALAELSEYSARFNADQDESMYRYR
jgi:hypothetical protein